MFRLCALVTLFASACAAQNAFPLRNAEAQRLFEAGEIAKAVALLEEIRPLAANDDERMNVDYNLGCGYSRLKENAKAVAALRRLADAGFARWQRLEEDRDFDNIRQDPGFQAVFKELQRKAAFWDSPAMRTPFQPQLSDAEKLAGLARFWSEARYNFAWFENVPDLDWDRAYVEAIPRVLKAASTLEYYRELQRFCALLRDGHTNVYLPGELAEEGHSRPAIRTRLVEGRVAIVELLESALKEDGLAPGMEIVAIDGIPAREYAENRVMPFESASTPQDLEVRVYEYSLLSGSSAKPVRLTLTDGSGKTFERTLARLTPGERGKLGRKWNRFEFRMLKGNVAHIVLNTFGDNAVTRDFEKAWPEVRKAAAVILDVRDNGGGSSGVGWDILKYLTAEPFAASTWRTRLYRPSFRAWGYGEVWHSGDPWKLQPKSGEPYRGPVVVLTSPRSYSAAEDFAVVFDAMKRGTIIGESTGGSTGQPLPFALPGGGSARICTKQDRYPDGRRFVGTGVQPGVLVKPTIAALREGRDEVLDVALATLKAR